MAGSVMIQIKDPLTNETHFFNPKEVETDCELADDFLHRGSGPALSIKYSLSYSEIGNLITVSGMIKNKDLNFDFLSASHCIPVQIFADEFAYAAFHDDYLENMPTVKKARQAITDEAKEKVLYDFHEVLIGQEFFGFGYLYVNDIPAVTIKKIIVTGVAGESFSLRLEGCASVTDFSKVSHTSMSIVFSCGDKKKMTLMMPLAQDIKVTEGKIWQIIQVVPATDIVISNDEEDFIDKPNITDTDDEDIYYEYLQLLTGSRSSTAKINISDLDDLL